MNAGVTSRRLTSLVAGPNGNIYLGSQDGVFKSTNEGESWSPVNSGLYVTAIDDLEISPEGHLYAGAGYGGVYRSTNGGAHWTFRGLGGKYVQGIKCAGRSVFVATWGDGVFHTTNGGQAWTAINEGLTDLYVASLATSGQHYLLAGSGYSGVLRSVQQVTLDVQCLTASIPSTTNLFQNYPNPFNPNTNIKYQIPSTNHVTLKVFDLLGREVATLVNDVKEPGTYTVRWDASGVASGVYFYRLKAGDFVETKRMLLMR
jgi:hypothetical protein